MKKKLLVLPIVALSYISSSNAQTQPQEIEFNASFLRSNVDISHFSHGNPVEPGLYKVYLYVNNNWKGSHSILFEQLTPDAFIAQPCFDLNALNLLDIDISKLDAQVVAQLNQEKQCLRFDVLVSGGKADFDSSTQKLNVSVPQVFLLRNTPNYANPQLWNDGVSAATLQYDYNIYQSKFDGLKTQTTQYLGLRSGLNVGAWRLRHRGALQWNNQTHDVHYQNSSIYLERGISEWKSRLTIGNAYTNGQVFDGINFRGIQLASDDRMLPDSARGFAPVVRGIANSNALVQIRQDDALIYETTVPPGAFVIDDISPSGRGSDLLVTIKEANGGEHSFTLPYSPLPGLLRPQTTRFSLMAGQFKSNAVKDAPAIAMGTIRHGFSNLFTANGGVIVAEGYAAISLGLAANTKAGAFAVDVTRSHANLPHLSSQSGHNVRFSYAKVLPVTNTNLSLNASHSSSSGYYDTKDALILRDTLKQGNTFPSDDWRQRNRVALSASQTLPGKYGSFTVNVSNQNYWGQRKAQTEFQLSYSNNIYKQISFTAAAQRSRNLATHKWENQIMFSLSMPLGRNRHSPNWRSGFTKLSDSTTYNNSLNGSLGENSQFNYSVFTNTVRPNGSGSMSSYGGNLSWAAPYATVNASTSTGKHYSQYGMNLSGGVVVYSEGIVFAPTIGDTIAIVEASQAQGAKINGYGNLTINNSGKTVVPYMSPYRKNTVEIDPRGVSTDVEFEVSSQNIIPTAGAVSLVNFATNVSYSVLINGRKPNGDALPFGASVFDVHGQNIGYIAQGSQALLRVQDLKGMLRVQWGSKPEDQCSFAYQIEAPQALPAGDFRRLDVVCH